MQTSSREYKDDIADLTTKDAFDALEGLTPVTYVYKSDRAQQHVGFIAEDVPDLVATQDRKGLSSMDVVAVLTKVVKEQQKVNEEQQAIIQQLQEKNSRLEQLEQRLLALEGK